MPATWQMSNDVGLGLIGNTLIVIHQFCRNMQDGKNETKNQYTSFVNISTYTLWSLAQI